MTEKKSPFLIKLSHEINPPINGILGCFDLLRETSLTPEQITILNNATHSAESLLKMANEVELQEIKNNSWNEAATLKYLENDNELLDDMIQLFLDKVPSILVDIKRHEAADNFVALTLSAHTLRGMVKHFFAKTLILKISVLENAARENKIAKFKSMTDEVVDLTTQLIRDLSKRRN
jgi:signal transduction histidine kinase